MYFNFSKYKAVYHFQPVQGGESGGLMQVL